MKCPPWLLTPILPNQLGLFIYFLPSATTFAIKDSRPRKKPSVNNKYPSNLTALLSKKIELLTDEHLFSHALFFSLSEYLSLALICLLLPLNAFSCTQNKIILSIVLLVACALWIELSGNKVPQFLMPLNAFDIQFDFGFLLRDTFSLSSVKTNNNTHLLFAIFPCCRED